MTPAELLAEIERLERAATPGPLQVTGTHIWIEVDGYGADQYGHPQPEQQEVASAGEADCALFATLRNNLPAILFALRGVEAARALALKHGIGSMAQMDDATGTVEFGWYCCNECLAQAASREALEHETNCALAALSQEEKVTL